MPPWAPILRGLLLALAFLAVLPASRHEDGTNSAGLELTASRCSAQALIFGEPGCVSVAVTSVEADEPDVATVGLPVRVATLAVMVARHPVGTTLRRAPARDDPPHRPPRIG